MPSNQIAGNHKHEKQEALLGIGATVFLWQDGNGQLHEEVMNPDDELYLFIISSGIPHAVINKSPNEPAILYEYFDDVQKNVKKVDLLQDLERS